MRIAQVILVSYCIYLAKQQSIPEAVEFEAVYKGEGVNCDGTYANITLISEEVVESEEGVAEAVALAIADAQIIIQESQQKQEAIIAQANVTAKVVLNVVARAVASVIGEINSPNEGCWAIGWGKTQAVATANATVRAIALGVAEAFKSDEEFVAVEAAVESVENDIRTAVEGVMLLLADGSGVGVLKDSRSVQAEASVQVVNCAFVEVFGAILGEEALAGAIAEAGCFQEFSERGDRTATDGCACVTPATNSGVVSNYCGIYGDLENGDNICYVVDPSSCPCAQTSVKYAGSNLEAWRYCGQTLLQMQTYLGFDSSDQDITSKVSGYGYCSPQDWDPSLDFDSSLVLPTEFTPQIDGNPLLPTMPIMDGIGVQAILQLDDYTQSPEQLTQETEQELPPSPTQIPIQETIPEPLPQESPTYMSSPPSPIKETDLAISFQLVSLCPLNYCLGGPLKCCQIDKPSLGQACLTEEGKTYTYQGKCAIGFKDVWKSGEDGVCKCIP
eukprot:TRINITY_DN3127_c0_g1_i3.p1 TRINITY_DN3127_c0_g1~~TRINITY_DN3127_c0_g1_i3.p1  ORF type:complete len:502 (-),score=64.85 TRINITY_DN3127_c0_g1_i3:1048-2553(-)